MARPQHFVGNWKMYKTTAESVQFLRTLAPLVQESQACVSLAVPFTAISPLAQEAENSCIRIGAQNMNDASEGAFTGEIAAGMLKEAGAGFVILGHSERRHIFGETNAFINRKVRRALQEKLPCIVCIGETLEQREQNATEQVLEQQLTESLEGIQANDFAFISIAYEPVWAIGTGKSATSEMAQQAHAFCREVLAKQWNQDVAEHTSLLYGGSVKPANASELMQQSDIDGLLIGGASLQPESFAQIIQSSPNS